MIKNYTFFLVLIEEVGKEEVNCENVDEMLEDIGAKHIVIGHTPQRVINSKCDNKIWRIDVGLSKSLGDNEFQILEIKTNDDKSYSFNILN